MTKHSDLKVTLQPIEHNQDNAALPSNISRDDLLTLLSFSTEHSADEVFWMTADSSIVYVNEAACSKLGYRRSELIGMKVWQWDPLFPQDVWPSFWHEIKTHKHLTFETQHQTKLGVIFPVRIKAHFFEHNEKELLFAFVSDISEEKTYEQQLEQSREQLSALLEQEKRKFEEFVSLAPVGIAINKMENGKFEYINAEFARFTGYDIDELNSMDYWQLTPSKYEAQEMAQLEALTAQGSYGPYQKEYIHKQGHTYPVLLSGIRIIDVNGDDYIWSVVQDISRQKHAETLIEQAKEAAVTLNRKMQLANNSAGIGVWEWDLVTNSLTWDDWMYKLYGVNKNEFSGAYEAWESRVHKDDIDYAKAQLGAAIDGTGVYDTEFRVVRPDGQIRTMKASAEVVCDENAKPILVVGVNYDISDKVNAIEKLAKAKREAERAAKSKSDFLANMSHEIRTPMNAILGALQLLQGANLKDDLQTVLDNATFSAQSLLTIINDILDYSKIESNRLELELAPFSFYEIAESVKYDLDAQVSKKGIQFNVTIGEGFIDGWLGDLVRVKQILLNLASNAVKFTQQGAVNVVISQTHHKQGNAVKLTVTDSGIGMSEEAQQRIFERFFQADSSTSRKYGGTGLGMSITISLVKLMNGTIDLKSSENQGTEVTVILPLTQVELAPRHKTHKTLTPPILSGKNILIAEDNKINQVLIQTILKPCQANLTLVENGLQAVAAVKNKSFDLVLMDIQMPEMDGIAAQQAISDLNTALPVIAVTANVLQDDIETYLAQGFVDYIAKPYDISSLYQVISKCLP